MYMYMYIETTQKSTKAFQLLSFLTHSSPVVSLQVSFDHFRTEI